MQGLFWFKIFLKKISILEIVLINSFTILLKCTPLNTPPPPPPWKIYLRVLIFICGKLFLFMITCENLFFCENIFPSMIISDNLFEAFLFARIAFYLCPSVKMSSYLSSFHKCVHFIKHVFKVMVLEYIF